MSKSINPECSEYFFKNDTFNILSENLTLKQIVYLFKKYKKNTKIKYQKSKLINQFPYEISNKKFCLEAFRPKFKISNDIKLTLNLFKNLNK